MSPHSQSTSPPKLAVSQMQLPLAPTVQLERAHTPASQSPPSLRPLRPSPRRLSAAPAGAKYNPLSRPAFIHLCVRVCSCDEAPVRKMLAVISMEDGLACRFFERSGGLRAPGGGASAEPMGFVAACEKCPRGHKRGLAQVWAGAYGYRDECECGWSRVGKCTLRAIARSCSRTVMVAPRFHAGAVRSMARIEAASPLEKLMNAPHVGTWFVNFKECTLPTCIRPRACTR
jgi:hypothetical protein